MRSKTPIFGRLILFLCAGYSEKILARGYHNSYSEFSDWMLSLIFIGGAALLLVVSLVNAVESWRNKIYLKCIAWWAAAMVSCWMILNQTNWSYVYVFGLSVVVWCSIGFSMLAIGFILKTIVGAFYKPVRNLSAEEFVLAIASFVGVIGFSIVYIFMIASVVLGIPILIISMLLDL